MKLNNFFNRSLILFFLLILAVPTFWVARGKVEPQKSLMEDRYLSVFPSLSFQDLKSASKRILQLRFKEAGDLFFNQFSDLSFQDKFQRATREQFPFRSTGIRLSKGFDRLIIRMAYLPLPDIAIPADTSTGIYVTRETPSLFHGPVDFSKSQKKDINEKIADYNAIIELHPGIHFYAFCIEVIENSAVNPLNPFFPNADAGRSLQYFRENKPDKLNLETFTLTSFSDQQKYFFHTDHHWNIQGVLLGYEKIYGMLKKNYPDMSPMVTHDNLYTFPDIDFHGSLSRLTFYQIEPGDKFEVALPDLPAYRTYDQNGKEFTHGKKAEYLAGNYSREPFADHYEYYGAELGFVEYVFDNGADRNLLIIGDSYSNSIETLLASHYHHTYMIDIRRLPDYYFSLSEFLARYDVQDVLILGGVSTVMHQWQWTINP